MFAKKKCSNNLFVTVSSALTFYLSTPSIFVEEVGLTL